MGNVYTGVIAAMTGNRIAHYRHVSTYLPADRLMTDMIVHAVRGQRRCRDLMYVCMYVCILVPPLSCSCFPTLQLLEKMELHEEQHRKSTASLPFLFYLQTYIHTYIPRHPLREYHAFLHLFIRLSVYICPYVLLSIKIHDELKTYICLYVCVTVSCVTILIRTYIHTYIHTAEEGHVHMTVKQAEEEENKVRWTSQAITTLPICIVLYV